MLNSTLLERAHKVVRYFRVVGQGGLLRDIMNLYVDGIVVVRPAASR
jgi:hypothetical protein